MKLFAFVYSPLLAIQVVVFSSCANVPSLITVPLTDISSMPIHFSFLNLDRSPDRKAKMMLQLDAAQVSYERQSAVDGKSQNIDDLVEQGIVDKGQHQTSPLKPGEIGVYLSTLEFLVQRQKRNDDKLHFLLEDDAIVPVDVEAELKVALQLVPNDWDLLYLGCYLDSHYNPNRGALVESPYSRNESLQPVCPLVKQSVVTNSPWVKLSGACTAGGYAFAVRQQSVATVIDYLKPIRFPSDDTLRRGFGVDKKFNAYCLNPNLIRTRFSTDSTIR